MSSQNSSRPTSASSLISSVSTPKSSPAPAIRTGIGGVGNYRTGSLVSLPDISTRHLTKISLPTNMGIGGYGNRLNIKATESEIFTESARKNQPNTRRPSYMGIGGAGNRVRT